MLNGGLMSDEPRTIRFTIRLTAVQFGRAQAMAARLGLSVSEAVRRLVDEALEAREQKGTAPWMPSKTTAPPPT